MCPFYLEVVGCNHVKGICCLGATSEVRDVGDGIQDVGFVVESVKEQTRVHPTVVSGNGDTAEILADANI